MTLQEFISKYKGKTVDWDKNGSCQCVDLARTYMHDVWGFTKQPECVDGAADFFFKHNSRPIQKELCRCIPYTGAVLPPVGSLLVFKSSGTNKDGHIAVCIEATASGMEVLEQDGVANAKAIKEGREQKGAYIGCWNYDRLVGWLTKKDKEEC